MEISWVSDICAISSLTRVEIGAVELTQGQDAADAGPALVTASNGADAAARLATTSIRFRPDSQEKGVRMLAPRNKRESE
jgi:hypothetical protein